MLKGFLLAAFLLCGSAYAQSQPQEPKLAPSVPNPRIKTRYDRFSDLTTVHVSLSVIGGIVELGGGSVYARPSARDLELTVMGILEGQEVTTAVPRVTILATSRSEDWVYLRSPNLLQVIIDGKTRATLGEMKRITGEVQTRGRGVVEQLSLELNFSVIQKLSKASKLEMRIGPDEFELNKRQLGDLQDWVNQFPASHTKPVSWNSCSVPVRQV